VYGQGTAGNPRNYAGRVSITLIYDGHHLERNRGVISGEKYDLDFTNYGRGITVAKADFTPDGDLSSLYDANIANGELDLTDGERSLTLGNDRMTAGNLRGVVDRSRDYRA